MTDPQIEFTANYPLSKCYSSPERNVPILLHRFIQAEQQHAEIWGQLNRIAEILSQILSKLDKID